MSRPRRCGRSEPCRSGARRGKPRSGRIVRTGSVLAGKAFRTTTAGGVAPAHLPAAPVLADAHEYPHPVATRWVQVWFVATWQQYPRWWTDAPTRLGAQKSPAVRGFPSAPERTRTSTDQSVHKALNLQN